MRHLNSTKTQYLLGRNVYSINEMKEELSKYRKDIKNLRRQINNIRSGLYSLKKTKESKKKIIEKLGGKCAKEDCEIDDHRILQIDHINPKRISARKDKDYKYKMRYYEKLLNLSNKELLENYQLLCCNHNWLKRIENNEAPYLKEKDIEEREVLLQNLIEKRGELKEKIKELKNTELKIKIEFLSNEQSLTDKQIGDILGYSGGWIARLRKQLNIPTNPSKSYKKIKTLKWKNKIQPLVDLGLSKPLIAEELNCCIETLRLWGKRAEISFPRFPKITKRSKKK